MTAREKAWREIRRMGRFTVADLVSAAGIKGANAGKYVADLARAGILRQISPKDNGHKGGHALYELARDIGPDAPRVLKNGEVKAFVNARQRMWQAMRIMRRFTIPDLAATAGTGASNAEKYLGALERAGYVRRVKERDSGRPGGHIVWGLGRNTGPHAPRVRKGAVEDPNTGEETRI